jgi:hypothetical protein
LNLYDDFATGAVAVHQPVGGGDLVEVKDSRRLGTIRSAGSLAYEFLETGSR